MAPELNFWVTPVLHRLFGEGKTLTGLYNAKLLLGRFDVELLKELFHLAKKKCFSTMATRLLTVLRHYQIGRIRLRPAATLIVFYRFGSMQLFFPNVQKSLLEQKFLSTEEVAAITKHYCAKFQTFFRELKKLVQVKCSDLKEDYVEI